MPPKTEEEDRPSNDESDNVSLHSLLDEEIDRTSLSPKKVQHYKTLKYIRIGILFIFWLIFTPILMVGEKPNDKEKGVSVPIEKGKEFPVEEKPSGGTMTVILTGPFMHKLSDWIERKIFPHHHLLANDNTRSQHFLIVSVMYRFETETGQIITESVSKPWRLVLESFGNFDEAEKRKRAHVFELSRSNGNGQYFYRFELENVVDPLPLSVRHYPSKINTTTSVVLSSLIIVCLYSLLFWDMTSRAIIGMIFSTLSVALASIYHLRPSIPDIATFVTIDYILLLIGLTIIFGVLAETGGDLYMAVQIFRWSKGHLWPMLTVLCIITAAGSAFLDQVTILMLITSFTLRICEIQELNPANVLTCLILFSNIGYMLTPVGIIQSSVLTHPGIKNSTYKFKGFGAYMMQMLIPVIIALALTYTFLRLYYRSTKSMQIIEPPIVSRLRHAIRFWTHTAKSLGDYSDVEKTVQQSVHSKVNRLRNRLRHLGKTPVPSEDFNEKLKRLEEKHTIKDKAHIIMCAIIILVVILMQFAFFFNIHYLRHGWTCALFSFILLALVNWNDFDSLMTKIDWSTVFLTACIMIITNVLSPLGILEGMGDFVVKTVCDIDSNRRDYLGAIILICVSAFGSAFLDTAFVNFSMIGTVMDIIRTSDTRLQMEPLILAVLLGSGFGCNVTLISAWSNIVVAGLAEKHEFKFYFWDFFKVGAIVTFFNLILSIVYVLLFILVLHD